MYDGESAEPGGVRTPPYVSFQTFLTLIEDFKTNGLPPRIDRSVLKRFSGGVGGQLQTALKSLGLADEGNVPTERLKRMVDAFGSEAFKSVLRESLEFGYPFLAKLDLKTATPSMFAEEFRKATSAREDVLKKCRRFYIYAAQFCGVELGNRLTAGAASPPQRTSGGASGYKRRARRQAAEPSGEGVTPPPAYTGQPPASDPVQVLMSIMDMEAMDEKETEAVWTLVKFLKRPKGAAAPASSKGGSS